MVLSPVDEYGNRIGNEEFMLNYIVDFTEAEFANQLVAEINGSLPQAASGMLSHEDLERVALQKNMDEMELMMALYSKKYIVDTKLTLNQTLLDDFYAEYPEFNVMGISGGKVIDKNKKASNTVKVRAAKFEEIKELWSAINKNTFFSFIVKWTNVRKDLPELLKEEVFSQQELTSIRQEVQAGDNQMGVVSDVGVTYLIKGRKLPYETFLKRANRATSIPIKEIHKAVVAYAAANELKSEHINETSLANFIKSLMNGKVEICKGVSLSTNQLYSKQTGLTNADGSVKKRCEGSIGFI